VANRATRDRDRFDGDAEGAAVMPMPRSLARGELSVFPTLGLSAVRMAPFGRFELQPGRISGHPWPTPSSPNLSFERLEPLGGPGRTHGVPKAVPAILTVTPP